MFDEKIDLRIPGPTPVPASILLGSARPLINHRGSTFHKAYPSVRRRLEYVFQTRDDIYILTGSGTAGMEAAVANLVADGEEVLALVGGAFGQRWSALCQRYGAQVHALEFEWGTAVDPHEVARMLKDNPKIKIVFATQNESSTGVVNDIEALSKIVHEDSDRLLVVDAVSSLGGMELWTEGWQVDVVVTASQKCLMLPPGIAMISLSENAKRHLKPAKSLYFDLTAYDSFAEKNETPFTPNVQLIMALNDALGMIEAEGLDNVIERHKLMRDMVRRGLSEVGLSLVVPDEYASPTVTAIWAPEGVDIGALRKVMREEFETELAGGQGKLANNTFRIGHMGFSTPIDMLRVLAALELGLARMGRPTSLGIGVRAAQEVLLSRRNTN